MHLAIEGGAAGAITHDLYDVVVVGGGLAGQCLARQVGRDLPDQSILVIDMLDRPLPEAAFKVGEATVEMGAHYLAVVLGLASYLEKRHVLKYGLRYFFGDAEGSFADRSEMGLTEPPFFNSYLIDRGRLENDLREMNAADGVSLAEGAIVEEIQLSHDGQPHLIRFRRKDSSVVETVQAQWVVDATGRRRMLQRKLDLGLKEDTYCSASWFRVTGRVDVDRLVPQANKEWHSRVPERLRHRAVVHLLGDGYWVWIIAISSEATSIGIVADERIHPFSTYSTQERTMSWLNEHEPELAAYLKAFPVLDFRVMKRYSYTSKRVFSIDRWSCVGEAAVFADPFYAPGIDMIGVGNTITVEMIKRERLDLLDPRDVDRWSKWFINFNHALRVNIQNGYPFFGTTTPASAKLLWDFAAAWGYEAPQLLNVTYLDLDAFGPVRAVTSRFIFLQVRMQRLFADWAALGSGRCQYRFLDYFTLRYLLDLRDRNLKAGKRLDELTEDARANMEVIEELAQALFLVAVEDQLPEHRERFLDPVWVDAWAVGMDPSRWEADGLFRPRTESRDLRWIKEDLFRGLGVPR